MHLRYFFISLCIAINSASFSQVKLNLEDWKNLKFRNIGPAGMSGRVTAIDVDLSSGKIYLGAASGGVWVSDDEGASFSPIFEDQSSLCIGAIKINQSNPSEIWVGTGEGNPRNSVNTGNGIYKTIDGGNTWRHMGLDKTKTIHRIIIHRDNPDIVYAAALGSPWGPHEERGVYKTVDGGKSWKKILYENTLTGPADMVSDPTNPNKLLVAMWEHQRKPWFFNSGGKGSSLLITYDGGDTWKKISSEDGLPKGDLGRIGIAIAASKPDVIYALIEAKENGLYRSDDGGHKWSLVSTKDIGGRPFYYSEIYVDPKNENRLYNVHTYLSKSDDGGKSFKDIANYGNAVHPDHHALWIHPENPNYIIDGNDGGAAISKDQGNKWTFVSNLPIGQFYHINVDNDFPYHVYGGMQDNGSWIGPSSVFKPGGIRNQDFQELYFGDGFDVVPYPKDSRYGYAMSQGGYLGFYDRISGHTKFIRPVHPDGKYLRFNWNAAIAQHPSNDCGVYYGSQYLHYSNDCGDSWTLLSDDLTTRDTSKLKQQYTGGLTADATGAENHCTIIAIAPSPLDQNVIWVGTDDGNIQLTKDGGKSWILLNSKIGGLPKNAWIAQIEVSKHNAGEAFVVVNDYRKNDYYPYAYHTSDYGATWTRIADPSQIKSFVLSIVQDTKEPNLLFLGTDIGLYFSFDKGKNWQHWDKGFPKVQVTDMKIHSREHDLVISTFGRALWILDDITPLRDIAKSAKILETPFKLFNPATAYNLFYTSYQGERFHAQDDYSGDNDNMGTGASIYVWSKPKKSEDIKEDQKIKDKNQKENNLQKADQNKDKAMVYILNESGDTIRHKKEKITAGLQKITWRYETDGLQGYTRRDISKDEDLPSGPDALPGKYKLVAWYAGVKDSVIIDYRYDPRIEGGKFDFKKRQEDQKSYQALSHRLGKAYDKVKDARKSIKSIAALLPLQEDTIKTKVEKLSKDMTHKLDSLDKILFTPEGSKGYVYDDDKLSSIVSGIYSYLESSPKGMTPNSAALIKFATSKVDDYIKGIDQTMLLDWASYKSSIQKLNLKIFKE